MRGTFVVALHDPLRRLSVIARDGMGNAAISYVLDDRRFIAGIDEAAVAEVAGAAGELDRLRLAEFYALAEVSGARTFFRAVRALLPGEMLLVSDHEVRRRSLPRPRLDLRVDLSSWEQYVEAFAERLARGVQRSLAGATGAAVLTSGGLDSPPLAALAARELDRGREGTRVTAISWRVSDPAADEPALVEAVARHAGIALEWVDCDDALPFADLARWPVHPATPEQTAYRWFHQRSYARAAKLGHNLLLSGFGGDALYGNARRWAWDLLASEGTGPTIDRLREVAKEAGWRRTLRSELLAPLIPRALRWRRNEAPYMEAGARDALRSSPTWPANAKDARRPRQAERLLALLDAHGGNVERFYTEPFGLEQRTPLRDFDLVQFMLAVPDHLLRQGRLSRPVLRAATRGLIPEEVRTRRRKSRFVEAIEGGLAHDRMRWASGLLLDPDALWRGFIAEASIRSWIATFPADDWSRVGFLNAIYGELWRRRRAGLPWPDPAAVA